MERRYTSLIVFVAFAALTVLMTWPQAAHIGSQVPDADDPLLSIWRISWIAHALPNDPLNLFNGNIFYPEKRTLAFTDAVLLQGLVAAPFIWSGISPIVVYNVLILGSIALSGWAMWAYAKYMTGSHAGALLGGLVFAFVPFRFEHFLHLELQATVFLPLALLWLERALDTGERRYVWRMMAAIAGQVYCGIYYAVFLITALAIAVPIRLRTVAPGRRRALLRAAVPAIAVALIVVLPYLLVYMMNRSALGDRSDRDVQHFSVVASDFLSTPEENVIYGRWSASFGGSERRLFPGVIAVILGALGLLGLDRRRVTLVVIGMTGLVIALGFTTPLYEWLRTVVFVYRGLRVPARAAIMVFLALAVLVAYGWAWLQHRLPASRSRTAAACGVGILIALEYATVMRAWYPISPEPPAVYRWLAAQPRSVIAELPVTTADRLNAIPDSVYMFQSRHHWYPIVNGYSGYYPQSYFELIDRMRTFPAPGAIDYLRSRGVELLVIHGGLLPPDQLGQTTATLLERKDLEIKARFEEPKGPDLVFRLLK